jgi:hypothetical protein
MGNREGDNSLFVFVACKAVEQQILLRSKLEQGLNVDNFDSGVGVEDIVRDELRRVLPK